MIGWSHGTATHVTNHIRPRVIHFWLSERLFFWLPTNLLCRRRRLLSKYSLCNMWTVLSAFSSFNTRTFQIARSKKRRPGVSKCNRECKTKLPFVFGRRLVGLKRWLFWNYYHTKRAACKIWPIAWIILFFWTLQTCFYISSGFGIFRV
jgi:hypothetical protein